MRGPHCRAMPKAAPGLSDFLVLILAFWSAVAVTGALSWQPARVGWGGGESTS